MNGDSAVSVVGGLNQVRAWQEDFYRTLHRHPELSRQERQTAVAVAQRLRTLRYDVREQVGGTGVVGILHNGAGPTVLLRAEMDALPIQEQTGLPYASTITTSDAMGTNVPVMHACGHDVHIACLLGAAALLAAAPNEWSGTVVTLFQPAEELGDGARGMVEDGLLTLIGGVDVALAQHVLPFPAGEVATRSGPVFSAADSMRITVYGRGGHASMPHAAVDPVLLAAMIVIRLQTVISREIPPTEPAVLTVASIHAGTKSNVIADHAVLQLNIRSYTELTRQGILAAVRRIVIAECQASASEREPEFELFGQFPPTHNHPVATERVRAAFVAEFGDQARELPLQSASEDFSDLANAFNVPYTYWGIGSIDPDIYHRADAAGRVTSDLPFNHSAHFAPVIQPTLDTGTRALVAAALAWLAPATP